jgi:hypothetical protein
LRGLYFVGFSARQQQQLLRDRAGGNSPNSNQSPQQMSTEATLMSMNSDELNESLESIAEQFKQNVQVKDRKYRLTTYKDWCVTEE